MGKKTDELLAAQLKVLEEIAHNVRNLFKMPILPPDDPIQSKAFADKLAESITKRLSKNGLLDQ